MLGPTGPDCPQPGAVKDATANQHTIMHHYCKTIGALAAASALGAGNAKADIEYKLHTGYSNEYLFRGLDLGNDLIEAGVDVSGTWNGVGLSAGAWFGSFTNGGRNFEELDLYGEVSKDIGPVKAAIGYIAYTYPSPHSDAYQEIYFGVSHDFGFVAASLKYFWDVKGDNNGYTEFGLTHSFTLSPCLTLNLESNIGYLVEKGVATAWTNKASLDWGFAEHAKLSPFVAASIALTDSASTAYYNSKNELVGGCMLSVTF